MSDDLPPLSRRRHFRTTMSLTIAFEREIRHEPLEPTIFVLEPLEPLRLTQLEPAALGPPAVNVVSVTACFRHSSRIVGHTSASCRMPTICSSVDRFYFSRPHRRADECGGSQPMRRPCRRGGKSRTGAAPPHHLFHLIPATGCHFRPVLRVAPLLRLK